MSMLRRVMGLAATVAIGLVLAACTLSSETDLVEADALATPLPASFALFPYKAEGVDYVRTDDTAPDYVLEGAAYVAGDHSMTIRFIPLDGDTYLMATSGADPGALYGTITIHGDVIAIRMIFGDGLKAAIDAATAGAPAAIAADITVAEGGIKVTKRETLDYVIGLIRDGTLPTSPLVAWIGPVGNAKPPARIVADGEGFKVAD